MNLDIRRYPIFMIIFEGDYIAIPTDFYGYIVGEGKTPEEAMENLKLAVREWEDLADEQGLDVPEAGSVPLKELYPVLSTLGINSWADDTCVVNAPFVKVFSEQDDLFYKTNNKYLKVPQPHVINEANTSSKVA